MPLVPRLRSLWNTLVHKDRLDTELDAELGAAVETLARRHVEAGMAPDAARRAAIRAVGGRGGIEHVRSEVREARVGAGLDALLLDVRYAGRPSKNRGVTAVIGSPSRSASCQHASFVSRANARAAALCDADRWRSLLDRNHGISSAYRCRARTCRLATGRDRRASRDLVARFDHARREVTPDRSGAWSRRTFSSCWRESALGRTFGGGRREGA